jgi:hypothetical protein
MESPHSILGVSPDATPSQIEAAFQKQWTFWNDLRSNANRAAEAEAMIARLEFAHGQALAKFKGQEGGLVDPAPTTQRGFGGDGVFASAQGGIAKAIDKDVCPQCGMRKDSPAANFCTNKECKFEFNPCCPGCGERIPWYKEICPNCGIDIEEVKEKTRRKEEAQQEEIRRRDEAVQQARVQELRNQLQDLTNDLAWVQSRSSLTAGGSKSGDLMVKYGVKRNPADTGCIVAVLMIGMFAFLVYILMVVREGSDLFGLRAASIIGTAIIAMGIAGMIAMNRSDKKNKIVVEQTIEQRIAELKQQLSIEQRKL